MTRNDINHTIHYGVAIVLAIAIGVMILLLRSEDRAIDTVAAGPAHLGFAPSPQHPASP
jgi:hypothetical protein